MPIVISIYYCTCSVTTTSNSYKIIIKAFDKRFNGFRNKHSAYKHQGWATFSCALYKILHLTPIWHKKSFS